MANSIDSLIASVRSRIRSLLHDDVIEHTIVVMRELGTSLSQLARFVKDADEGPSANQKEELKTILLFLTSESIREALHKSELGITNGIIRSKNNILTALGVAIPDDHQEINARDYPNYNW